MPDKRLVGNIPQSITVNSTAHGYTLLKYIIYFRQNPVLISLATSSLTEYSDKGSNKYLLLTKNIKEKIQRQFSELNINYLLPDTLFFEMSDVVKQYKKVKPNLDIDFEKQYTLSNRIICVPDSVELTGPKAVLDTIKYAETKDLIYKKVNKIFQVKMNLKLIPDIAYNHNIVTVVVPVDKYTESEIHIAVIHRNVPSNFKMKTFPAKIKVTYKVSLDNYKYINENQFLLTVNYNEINNSINNKIKLNLEQTPYIIWDVNYKPKTVEFILERR